MLEANPKETASSARWWLPAVLVVTLMAAGPARRRLRPGLAEEYRRREALPDGKIRRAVTCLSALMFLFCCSSPVFSTQSENLKPGQPDVSVSTEPLLAGRQSEARWKALSHASFEAIFLSCAGICLDQNHTAEVLFGYSREEAAGMPGTDWIAPEDREMVRQKMMSGHEGAYEITALRKDGSTFPAEIQGRMIQINHQEFRVTAVRDISDRKAAAAILESRTRWFLAGAGLFCLALLLLLHRLAVGLRRQRALTAGLRASEDHLSATLRSIGDGVIACDAAGAVVSLNAAAEALTGWSTAEAAGKPIGEVFCIVNAMTRETVENPVIRAIREGVNVDLANHTALIAKDGTERQIADSCAPIRDASGAVTGAVLVFRDVTEEYRRREELCGERMRLAGIIEGTHVGTWEWNVQTGETVFNERWAEIVGYTLEEIGPVTIETWMKFAHPDDLNRSGELLEQHFSGELDYYNFESRMRHKNGEWVWVHDRGRVVSWTGNGKPLLMLGTHQDITERKRAEAAKQFRFSYQHAVADISARLLTVTADTQDEAIAFVLQRLGTLLGVDRGYVFGFSDDLARMTNTHEWCAEGIEPQMERSQNMSTGAMPWWKGEITQNKPVHIPSVNGLPPEAQAEQAEFVAQGIQSLLSFPMIDQDGRLIGFMGFDAVRKACTWSEQAIAKLRLTADLLASAMGRNRALRELAESEEKFRQMGENMGEVFWLRSADTARMLYISPAYERVWGRSCQSLYEEPGSFVESIHEEDKPSVFKAYEEYSKTAVFDMEYRILRPDGEIRWVHARSFQVKNADGEITAHTGIATDITDRVLREQELDRAKKQTDQFFGQSLHGFFFCMLDEPIEWNAQADKDRLLEYVLDHQRMTRVNQAMLDQYGATEEDFVGITVRELFQHDLDHAREKWRSLFDRGKWHVETHEQKLDGTPVIIDGDYICLYDEQGRITGHFGVQVDITERKRAEEQLCLQALVLDQITDRVTVTDLEGRIIYVNEAEVQALGYGRDELIGVSTEIFGDDPERGATQRDVVEQTLRNGEWHGEIVNQAVDGRELIVDCRTQLVRDSEENPVALCGVSTDITDRKRAERELLDTNRELENATARANQMAVKAEMANTAKSEFLANMSHEIRTPMNGVIGMADLLRTTSLDGQQREMIETITRSADHLLTVIDEILDLSKMEAGQLRLDLCPFDLKQLIEEVVDIIRPQADDAGIAIAMHYDLNAPEVFLGDAVRIRQVLLNLAGNAVKFTSEGSIEISAHMQNRCGDRTTMRLSVTDTGIGIPADKLVTVFDKFTQVDGSSTRNTGGAGLGLAISKQLVELMSGAISVTSRPGSGSTFRVDLPLQLARQSAPIAPAQSSRAAGSSGPDLSVLVAEDNVVNQKVAQRILESLGCRVAMAADGRQAVAMAETSPFDLVFMDCQMPHMDGFEATAAIRCLQGAPAAVPIIAMTANAMKGDRERCLAAGMDDYVSKPIRRDTLAAVLDRWSGHLEHERERSATQTVP